MGISYFNCVIQPGHLAFSEQPAFVYGVCGNGVMVTIRDRVRRTGGAAHCVYPRLLPGQKPSHYYTEVAVKSLLKMFADKGSQGPNRLEAQLFGGGHYQGVHKKRAEAVVRSVRKLLKKMSIEIISEDVGGTLGRKVAFNTYSGETLTVKTAEVRRTDWVPELAYLREARYVQSGG